MPGAPLSLTSAPGRCPTRLLSVRARRPGPRWGLCGSLPPVGLRHGASPSSRTAGPRHSPWPRRPGSDPTALPTSAASPPAPPEPQSWPPAEGCPADCLPAAHLPGAGPQTAPSCEPCRPATVRALPPRTGRPRTARHHRAGPGAARPRKAPRSFDGALLAARGRSAAGPRPLRSRSRRSASSLPRRRVSCLRGGGGRLRRRQAPSVLRFALRFCSSVTALGRRKLVDGPTVLSSLLGCGARVRADGRMCQAGEGRDELRVGARGEQWTVVTQDREPWVGI